MNQFDQSKSKYSTSGVGIGLTNAKILCEALNGNIDLQSEVGVGTRVTFSIEMENC